MPSPRILARQVKSINRPTKLPKGLPLDILRFAPFCLLRSLLLRKENDKPATPHGGIKMKRMTPQHQPSRRVANSAGNRYSLAGGTVPQRVFKEEQPWRVRDIVVGPPASSETLPSSISLPDGLGGDGARIHASGVGRGAGRRESLVPITEEERKVGASIHSLVGICMLNVSILSLIGNSSPPSKCSHSAIQPGVLRRWGRPRDDTSERPIIGCIHLAGKGSGISSNATVVFFFEAFTILAR